MVSDEFLESLLRGESTLMRDPGAYDPAADVYNTSAEPMTPEALLASMRALWDRPMAPWGFPEFSWFRRPPRRLSLFWLGGEWQRQLERSAWEAGRSAWIESVRERLQSAVYAADNGYVWSWEAPGVFGVPGLPEQVQVRDATQPWRPGGGSND